MKVTAAVIYRIIHKNPGLSQKEIWAKYDSAICIDGISKYLIAMANAGLLTVDEADTVKRYYVKE